VFSWIFFEFFYKCHFYVLCVDVLFVCFHCSLSQRPWSLQSTFGLESMVATCYSSWLVRLFAKKKINVKGLKACDIVTQHFLLLTVLCIFEYCNLCLCNVQMLFILLFKHSSWLLFTSWTLIIFLIKYIHYFFLFKSSWLLLMVFSPLFLLMLLLLLCISCQCGWCKCLCFRL
jgi:hypothetical protein